MWTRIALLSFGGPAGQIAVMHRILVEEKRWIGDDRFLHALNFCMLLPGPEAQQLATYVGWLMHRTAGGLLAGILFVLPGAVAIMTLSIVYALFGNIGPVAAMFFGLKAAVLAIVLQAVVRIGRRALKGPAMVAIAGGRVRRDLRLRGAVPAHHRGGGGNRRYLGAHRPRRRRRWPRRGEGAAGRGRRNSARTGRPGARPAEPRPRRGRRSDPPDSVAGADTRPPRAARPG